jgi:CO/xanthine dehydrogenase Mo-binding subunit
MNVSNRRVVGHSLPRIDAFEKVTGKAIYASDLALPRMLFGRIFRSSVPHARIRKLDVSGARSLPGVCAVLTTDDCPGTRFGPSVKDTHVLAKNVVRFVGEPIVAIAATSIECADAAMAAIDIEYDNLPPVFDPEQALRDEAPLVHPEWESYKALPILTRDRNVSSRTSIRSGNVEQGFAESYRVLEHRFTTQIVHQGYTEPRVAVANWSGGDHLTVWCNTQLPFDAQVTLAEIFELPASNVRVIVPGIGGGFGGKLRIGVEHFAALLARKTHRPVRVLSTSEEELTSALPRQPTIITLKTGVSRDGLIVAKQGRVVMDTGAFAGHGPGTAASSLQVLAGPYRTPNLLLESVAVYTNKVPTGAFRAPSGPMGNFALECHMDRLAEAFGLDALEFRLRNIVHEGDLGPSGDVLKGVSIEECLRKAAAAIGWDGGKTAKGRGKGIACGWWMTTGESSGVFVKIAPDGRVALLSGAVEIGTGALTGAAQVLAEELGVDLTDIDVAQVDTQSVPYDYGAQGSRTAFSVGNACRAAAADLRRQMFEIASKHLDVMPDKLSLKDKAVFADNKHMTIAEIARISQSSRGGLIAHGTAISPAPPHDNKRVRNHPKPVWNSPSFHAHAVDLSVDERTGEVTFNRYVVVQDVGCAINPTYIEGQIEGGVAQGIGQALMEEIVYQDGRVLNANLTDYKMPTALDTPEVESILVEHASEAGPYGAKGVGEPPCIEPPAAIANAITNATGKFFTSLPITAERILHAIRDESQ